VPAGTCTWTTSVAISGKNIALEGAGQTSTIILLSGSRLDLGSTNSRVTGFGFITSAGAADPTDNTAPQPGNSGRIAYSVSASGATLSWTTAIDRISPQSALEYEVRLSTVNDIDTVAKAEAYGAIVKAYTPGISTATVAGWLPGTTYFFNVIAKDEAGNKSSYQTIAVTMPTAIAPPVMDTIAPLPGSGGGIAAAAITPSSLTLSWAKATDDKTAPSQLTYEVRRSLSNNIDSVGRAEANGTIVQTYASNMSSATVVSLNANTSYYFNVIVKDDAGNKAVYVTKSVTTAAAQDTTAPIPGGGGTITFFNVGTMALTVNWAKASDNVSPPSQLLYEVRRSTNNDIDSVMGSVVNGSIAQVYTADIASMNVSGLSPATTYYFNVIVKDAAGNRASYLSKSVTTARIPDTSAPISSNSGEIASPKATGTSVDISPPTP
jgi:Bacterial Ig-like domain